MGKIVYKRYQIRLHKKDYDILVPYRMPEKLWLAPYGYFYKNGEGSDLYRDRYAMKCLRNAFLTLAQEPDKIIYLPLNQRCISHDRLGLHRIPQLVFYNHTIQLKRREWRDILKIIQGGYRKPEQYVVYFNYPKLEKRYENMLHQWMKSKSYYRRDMIGEYFEHNTYFFESDQRNDLQVVVKMESDLRKDLEQMVNRKGYHVPVWMGPHTNDWGDLNFYFVDDEFMKEWNQ